MSLSAPLLRTLRLFVFRNHIKISFFLCFQNTLLVVFIWEQKITIFCLKYEYVCFVNGWSLLNWIRLDVLSSTMKSYWRENLHTLQTVLLVHAHSGVPQWDSKDYWESIPCRLSSPLNLSLNIKFWLDQKNPLCAHCVQQVALIHWQR